MRQLFVPRGQRLNLLSAVIVSFGFLCLNPNKVQARDCGPPGQSYIDWDDDGAVEKEPIYTYKPDPLNNCVDVNAPRHWGLGLADREASSLTDWEFFDCAPGDPTKYFGTYTYGNDADGDGYPFPLTGPTEYCTGPSQTTPGSYAWEGRGFINSEDPFPLDDDLPFAPTVYKDTDGDGAVDNLTPVIWSLDPDILSGELKYITPYDYVWGDGSVLLSATERTINLDCDPLDPMWSRADPNTGECMRDEDHDGVPDGVDKCSDPSDPQEKDYVYDSKYEIAERRGCPACPELYTAGGLNSIIYDKYLDGVFSEHSFSATSLNEYHSKQAYMPFEVIFSPVCPSNRAFKIKVMDVAKAAKVDHFNWWQSFRFVDADVFEIPDSYEDIVAEAIDKGTLLNISRQVLSRYQTSSADGWAQDLGENLATRFAMAVKRNPTREGHYEFSPFPKSIACEEGPLDSFPYYYNEVGGCRWDQRLLDNSKQVFVANRSQGFGFHFSDMPTLTLGFVSEEKPMSFIVRLAGVTSNGQFINFQVGTDWSSWNTNNLQPGLLNTAGNASNLGAPTAERLSRMVTDSIVGLDKPHAPNYLGRNPFSEETTAFMIDSGFTIRNVSYEFSDTVTKDLVIRQYPAPFAMADSKDIDVVLSLGKAASCEGLDHGATATRILYKVESVPFGDSCDLHKEVQTGTCYNGQMTWTGTANFESCSVSAPLACGDVLHGEHTTRIRYESATVPFGSSCDDVKETQTGTCYNGVLTFDGTFSYESCSVAPSPVAQCIKSKTHVCKAGLFEIDSCRIPGKILEAEVIDTYKSSRCKPESVNVKWWQILERLDTYKIDGDTIKAQFGCQAKLNVKYLGSCK